MSLFKKILGILLLLIIFVLGYFYLNSNLLNQKVTNKSSTQSSSVTNAPKPTTVVTIKDNKVIEIKPKDSTFQTVTTNFNLSQIIDKEFPGISGAQISNPINSEDNKTTTLYVINSNSETSAAAKVELELFKQVLDKKDTLATTGYGRLVNIFKDIDQIGGYQKALESEIILNVNEVPKEINQFRAMFTADGLQFPSVPTITILGKDGNDYFLIEHSLLDIKHMDLFFAANQKCGVNNYSVDECTKTEYQKLLSAVTTPEYLITKTKEVLNKFQF